MLPVVVGLCARGLVRSQFGTKSLLLSAHARVTEPTRRSVWPELMSRISEWDNRRYRERFNGWVPASVMALAVALMVAVSIPSIQDEFFGNHNASPEMAELFVSDNEIHLDPAFKIDQTLNVSPSQRPFAHGTPVIYRPEHW